MLTTLPRTVRTTLVVLAMAIVASFMVNTPAHATDDPPASTDNVEAYGSWDASGHSGAWFVPGYVTGHGSYNGAMRYDADNADANVIAQGTGRAGVLSFTTSAVASERRDNGDLLVTVMITTWTGYPLLPGDTGYGETQAWIAPGESVELTAGTRSYAGNVTTTATFTNTWTPPAPMISIDTDSHVLDGVLTPAINLEAALRSALVFPEWRVPSQGDISTVVYVAVGAPGASTWANQARIAHERLQEIDRDYWGGYSSADCDVQGSRPVILDGNALTVGAYFEDAADAHTFAASWERYFGVALGVYEGVETFCIDE